MKDEKTNKFKKLVLFILKVIAAISDLITILAALLKMINK